MEEPVQHTTTRTGRELRAAWSIAVLTSLGAFTTSMSRVPDLLRHEDTPWYMLALVAVGSLLWIITAAIGWISLRELRRRTRTDH